MTEKNEIMEKIEYFEGIKPRWEGKIFRYNLGNRLVGGLMAGLSGLCLITVPLTAPISIPLMIDGLGDVFSGQHHYVASRVFKALPSYELKKLRNELEQIDRGVTA